MSATVTYSDGAPLVDAPHAWNGDDTARFEWFEDGQLWERVAETPSNAPAPLTARQDAGIVRAYAERERRRRSSHTDFTIRQTPDGFSGMIRAGEHVK